MTALWGSDYVAQGRGGDGSCFRTSRSDSRLKSKSCSESGQVETMYEFKMTDPEMAKIERRSPAKGCRYNSKKKDETKWMELMVMMMD